MKVDVKNLKMRDCFRWVNEPNGHIYVIVAKPTIIEKTTGKHSPRRIQLELYCGHRMKSFWVTMDPPGFVWLVE